MKEKISILLATFFVFIDVLFSQSGIEKGNFVSDTFILYLHIYRELISSQDLPSCVFYPSCSRFSEEAIKEFGIVKGFLLTGDRLTRCNPFAYRYYRERRFGKLYDPVEKYRLDK